MTACPAPPRNRNSQALACFSTKAAPISSTDQGGGKRRGGTTVPDSENFSGSVKSHLTVSFANRCFAAFLCSRSLLPILNCGAVTRLENYPPRRHKIPVYEREVLEQANAELLRQIEESLAHSREVIAQINEVLAQKSRHRSTAGGFGFLTFSNAQNPNALRPHV